MIENMKPYLEHVKGNTYCIVTGAMRLPLYKINETDAVLMDSGYSRDWESILTLLQEENLRITSVLISHGHPDHIGNNANLRKQFGTKIYTSLFAAAVYASPMNLLSSICVNSSYRKLNSARLDYYLPDEIIDWTAPTVTVDGVNFGILQLPGHCAEQMGFVTPDGVAYIADLLLSREMVRSLSIPYCTCLELNLESIEKLLETRYDRYILAHSDVVDDIQELAAVNRDNLLAKVDFVEQLVEGSVTKNDLVIRFLQKTGKDLNAPKKVNGIHYNISALIGYLVDQGRLTETVRDGFVYYARPNQVSD